MAQAGKPNSFAPAVFIGEDTLVAIPAFCGGSSGIDDSCTMPSALRNWVFASTQWDTGKLPAVAADTYWAFWVAVWMEDSSGLLAEIEDHGLKAIPGMSLNSIADVPIETYSNNLGFYNQIFTVTRQKAGEELRQNDEDAFITEETNLSSAFITPAHPLLID